MFPVFSIVPQNQNLSLIDKECEDDPHATDYSPCQDGYYCVDDACNHFGDVFDCCKPKLGLGRGMCCDDLKDCADGLHCEQIENKHVDDKCQNRCFQDKQVFVKTGKICNFFDLKEFGFGSVIFLF